MINCKDCKFWGLNRDSQHYSDETRELKSCSSLKFDIGYWTKDEELLPDGVSVEGDEGWGFLTGPLFGCVHAERK